MTKYKVIAWCCVPLGVAGFVLVAASISTVLGETFLPSGIFPSLPSWTSSNAACIALAAALPLPYLALATRIRPGSTFLGFRRRLWFVIIAASYGSGAFVAGALLVAILLLG